MQHERYVGYEIKALSNLLRRRLWGPADHPQSMLTEIEGVLIGYLCHSPDEADHAHTPGAGAESGGRAADRRHRGDADQRHLSGGD